jgi:hypothetical protein
LVFLDTKKIFFGGGFLSKLLRLLFKVTKVTTGHQILPKISPNSKISPCLDPKGKKSLD